MSHYRFTFHAEQLIACADGLLWWPDQQLLCVSDLHLGKSDRISRRQGNLLPPYESADGLRRLAQAVSAFHPKTVVCLGDSFDDCAAAANLAGQDHDMLADMVARHHWIWIAGNHDPALQDVPGMTMVEYQCKSLTFRHEAQPQATGEISGHFHPKARLRSKGRSVTRPCFLIDQDRVILPAFGTYTGGLKTSEDPLASLMGPSALAILTGEAALPVPMPR